MEQQTRVPANRGFTPPPETTVPGNNHRNYHASPGASLALRAGSAEPRSTREGEARHLASPSSLLAPRVPHLTIAWVAVVVLDHRSSDLTLRNRRWTTQYGHKSLDSA